MGRGGKRIGAGRKKKADRTVLMRIPLSKQELIREWKKTNFKPDLLSNDVIEKLKEPLEILEKSLTLKANAGGKIKEEIRIAIKLINEI